MSDTKTALLDRIHHAQDVLDPHEFRTLLAEIQQAIVVLAGERDSAVDEVRTMWAEREEDATAAERTLAEMNVLRERIRAAVRVVQPDHLTAHGAQIIYKALEGKPLDVDPDVDLTATDL